MNTRIALVVMSLFIILTSSDACRCNGNSQYSRTLGREIGNCGTTIPLYSPRGRPWCYVNPRNSGCQDALPTLHIPGRYFSVQACLNGGPLGLVKRDTSNQNEPMVDSLAEKFKRRMYPNLKEVS